MSDISNEEYWAGQVLGAICARGDTSVQDACKIALEASIRMSKSWATQYSNMNKKIDAEIS